MRKFPIWVQNEEKRKAYRRSFSFAERYVQNLSPKEKK